MQLHAVACSCMQLHAVACSCMQLHSCSIFFCAGAREPKTGDAGASVEISKKPFGSFGETYQMSSEKVPCDFMEGGGISRDQRNLQFLNSFVLVTLTDSMYIVLCFFCRI